MSTSSPAADELRLQPDLRELVDTDAKRAFVQQLVVAWQVCRAHDVCCSSLQQLVNLGSCTAAATSSSVDHEQLATLIDVAHVASVLARRLSQDCASETLRRLCCGVARDCSCAAARIRRELLFGDAPRPLETLGEENPTDEEQPAQRLRTRRP
jgi:hypothetical protein